MANCSPSYFTQKASINKLNINPILIQLWPIAVPMFFIDRLYCGEAIIIPPSLDRLI